MSIIQVLIAIAISVMMGVFVMQTLLQMKKVEVLMNLSSEAQDVEIGIERALMSTGACGSTLYELIKVAGPIKDSSLPANLFSIYGEQYNIDDPTLTPPMFKVGDVFGSKKLQLESIRLVRNKPGTPLLPLAPNKVETLYLEVKLKKYYLNPPGTTPSSHPIDTPGGEFMIRRIPLLAQIEADGTVGTCTSLSQLDLARKICENDLKGKLVGSTCSLLDSPVIKKAACDALNRTWDDTIGCH